MAIRLSAHAADLSANHVNRDLAAPAASLARRFRYAVRLRAARRSSPMSHTGRTICAVWIESLRTEFAPVHVASHSGKQRSRTSIAK
jgi:hypothetical protein